jgi:hypothetical protein
VSVDAQLLKLTADAGEDFYGRLLEMLPKSPDRLRAHEDRESRGEADPPATPALDGNRSTGLDGVTVQLDARWSPENMRKEPHQRTPQEPAS